MNFSTELKTKLNGLRHTVELTWNDKMEIENKKELTSQEKQKRKEALRDKKAKELRQKKREIKMWLEDQKIDESKISEEEPSDSPKAQQFQQRALSRLEGLEEPGDVSSTVEEILEDKTVPEGYQESMYRAGKTKLGNLGVDGDSYYRNKLQRLRRKHLLDDNTVGLLRKSEAIEDISPLVEFTSGYLVNALGDKVFSDKITAPETPEELQEALDPVFEKGVKAIRERINEHKPQSKRNAG